MRHHNILIHDVLKFVPWNRFEQLVDRHDADRRVRTLDSKSQLIALIHAQLSAVELARDRVWVGEPEGAAVPPWRPRTEAVDVG